NPGAFRGRDLDPVPRAVSRPLVIEKSTLPERRRQKHHPAARNGEHGTNRVVERMIDAGSLVDDEKPDAREATDGPLGSGESDDARAVPKLDSECRFLGDRDRLAQPVPEVSDLPEELLRLPQGRAQKK